MATKCLWFFFANFHDFWIWSISVTNIYPWDVMSPLYIFSRNVSLPLYLILNITFQNRPESPINHNTTHFHYSR